MASDMDISEMDKGNNANAPPARFTNAFPRSRKVLPQAFNVLAQPAVLELGHGLLVRT